MPCYTYASGRFFLQLSAEIVKNPLQSPRRGLYRRVLQRASRVNSEVMFVYHCYVNIIYSFTALARGPAKEYKSRL